MKSVKRRSAKLHSAFKRQFNGITRMHISSDHLEHNENRKIQNDFDNVDLINRKCFPFYCSYRSYEDINATAKYLLDNTTYRPKIAVICGSGLSKLGEAIENVDIIPYQKIPNFPVSTVDGHSGQMLFGTIKSVPVMCMQGRFHYYEGYSLSKCCVPIRVAKLIGITHLIITNAAGGLNERYDVGDIIIIKDHINLLSLAGLNPLRGPNETLFGPRFLAMNKAYDDQLRCFAVEIARELNIGNALREGVYACTGGPTYETVAEARLLKLLGADCVGMSTVHETIVAHHCGIKVLGISFISNKCITDYECGEEPDHENVVAAGKKREPILAQLLRRIIARINAC